jgi:hypothetical protein
MSIENDRPILAFARCFACLGDDELKALYEPLSDTEMGKRLFRIGIGRKARPEIHELIRIIMETNPCLIPSAEGGYSRVEHLQSIPLRDETFIDERARAIYSTIPVGIVRTVIERGSEILKKPNACSVLVGLSDEDREAKSDYFPAISYIETSACDRACDHCATLASPKLPNIKFDEIARAFQKLGPSPFGLGITYGEPFRWSEGEGNTRLNIGHIISIILNTFPDIRFLAVITSGINFKDALESEAAEVLQKLPDSMKERITFAITLSDYPHFEKDGVKRENALRKTQMSDIRSKLKNKEISAQKPLDLGKLGFEMREVDIRRKEAARNAQIATIRFALENGFHVRFNSFMGFEEYAKEIARPLCSELFSGIDTEQVVTYRFDEMSIRGASFLGRQGLRNKRYFIDAPLEKETGQCFAYSGVRLPPRADLEQVLSSRLQVPLSLTLSPGGYLGPGCCVPPAHHAVISHIDKPLERIQEDTIAFMRKIRRMKAEGALTCMRCIGESDSIRDPARFRKVVGPDNAKLIPAEKLRSRRI